MMPMEAASLRLNPHSVERLIVKNMPNCAAAPKNSMTGFSSRGVKSIMAPTAKNISSGKSSVTMPALKSRLSAPCSTVPPAI